jgi:hypothetical protein
MVRCTLRPLNLAATPNAKPSPVCEDALRLPRVPAKLRDTSKYVQRGAPVASVAVNDESQARVAQPVEQRTRNA